MVTYRNTEAEYRDFRIGEKLENLTPSPALLEKLEKVIAGLEPTEEPAAQTIDSLKPNAALNRELLIKRAKEMDSQAKQLRRIADLVHERSVQDTLMMEFKKDNAEVNLLRASLLISKLDNVEMEPAHYEKVVGDMATEIRASLPKDANTTQTLTALGKYMFKENGYHGSRGDSYNRANSYIN